MFKKNVSVKKLELKNIIQVGKKRETAELVENFYTANPFPNSDDMETIQDLTKKMEGNAFTSNFKSILSIFFAKIGRAFLMCVYSRDIECLAHSHER